MILKPKQVAELLGVTMRTVERYAESGKLPVAFRLPGGARRYHSEDVEKLKRDGFQPSAGRKPWPRGAQSISGSVGSSPLPDRA